jgi:hypothetical protein
MALLELTLGALAKLDDGKAHEAFQRLLQRAIADCLDRPGDATARKVTLQVALVPVLDTDLSCTEVKTQIECKAALPAYRTKVYSMGPRQSRKGPMLVINEDSPDNIDQGTLLPEPEEND